MMKVIKAFAVIFICISCLTIKAFSQYPAFNAFKTLNVTDGLPQSFISGLVQDTTGFIWVGTRDGLARFDGNKFKVFRHISGDTTTLENNTITSIYLDKQSRLWIAYETGAIDVLDTRTEHLFHFTKDPVYKSVYGLLKSGHSIAEDAAGNIWMLCNTGGLFVYNINKRTAQYLSEETFGLQKSKIAGITASKGQIILLTDTALVTVNESKRIVQVVPFVFSNPHIYDSIYRWKDVYAVNRGNDELIIQDAGRFILYNLTTQSFNTITLPDGEKYFNFCMTQDSNGNVFFDYNKDVYVLSSENKIRLWKKELAALTSGYKSMLVDRSGVLWLGGNGSGLSLCDLRLTHWIGNSYEKSFHEDILQKYLKVPEMEIKTTFLYNMNAYRMRSTLTADGRIWFSKAVSNRSTTPPLCYYKGSHLVSPSWNYTDTAKNTHINISAVTQSKSGKVWGIDFYFRPVFFDMLTKAVTVYPSIASVNFEHTYTVNDLLIEGEDIFWITTALNGLYCYNKHSGKLIHYYSSQIAGSLPTDQLMNIVQDPVDPTILWIGSLGGGLIKFNKTTGRCQIFTTIDGLPNNTVYAVVVDKKGMLWCSSNKGIFSFHPRTGAIRSFTSKDGLPGDEFNRYHFLKFPDGKIAFGGVNGYTVFDPLNILEDSYHPRVALTDIHVNNRGADFGYPGSPLNGSINSLEEIVLPYDSNFIAFEFAALQYNITEKLQYRYKLEGFDNDWVNAGYENTAVYTKIPPGHYIFKVNATNTAGVWSNHVKTLSVTIEPPFWGTWWFVCIFLAMAGGLTYFLIQRHIEGVRKEEQQKVGFEREASELKAQALRAQMNPHFIFNCLNSIKALIQEDNKLQAVAYLTTFSKLIRNQLNNAQREVSLYEELQTCRLYSQLESLRFGKEIACEFIIEEGVDIHSLQVPPLIIQPFIENAIWHGVLPKGGGKVTVYVEDREAEIQCLIDDNGIGREMAMHNKSQKSSTYESKGMKLVKSRLNLYNVIDNRGGSIEVIDKRDQAGNASGTTVVLKFKKEE